MWFETRCLAAGALVAMTAIAALAAEPTVRLGDDGTVILYRAETGEHPGAVAERFGIAAADLPAFLTANGIRDATRVASGHVYRIPNPLAARAVAAETRASTLASDLDIARTEVGNLTARVATLEAAAKQASRHAARLERLAWLWPWMQIVVVALVAVTMVAGWAAYRSTTRLAATESYARGLTAQLDERRRVALAERQAAARKVLDLEGTVSMLERELASQPVGRPRPTGTH